MASRTTPPGVRPAEPRRRRSRTRSRAGSGSRAPGLGRRSSPGAGRVRRAGRGPGRPEPRACPTRSPPRREWAPPRGPAEPREFARRPSRAARACPRRSAGRSAHRRALRPPSSHRSPPRSPWHRTPASRATRSARRSSAPCCAARRGRPRKRLTRGPPTLGLRRLPLRLLRFWARGGVGDRRGLAGLPGPLDPEGIRQLRLDLACGVRVLGQVLLGVVATLAKAQLAVGEERAGLLHQVVVQREVEQAALAGDPGPVLDVELGLAEGRGYLVLDHLHPNPVADRLGALLEGLDAADVEPQRGVELQRPAPGLGL